MLIDRVIAKGQLVPLVFMQNQLAASQTDAQLPIVETDDTGTTSTSANDGYTMPFAGEVVAVAAQLSAAATAGLLTIGPTVGGTEDTALQLAMTTAATGSAKVPRETIRFNAGDVLGAEITTDGDWDATTADLVVQVWVLLSLEGI